MTLITTSSNNRHPTSLTIQPEIITRSQWAGRTVQSLSSKNPSQLMTIASQKRKGLEEIDGKEPKKLKITPLDEAVLSKCLEFSYEEHGREFTIVSRVVKKIETVADLLKNLPQELQNIAESYLDDLIEPITEMVREEQELPSYLIKHALNITSIDIFSKKLSDQQTFRLLGYFKNLQKINMPWFINDIGLSGVSQLHNVLHLEFNCARITDNGLASISALQQLKSLTLSFCELLTDDGTVYLEKLCNLQELKVHGCKVLTDSCFVHMQELHALQRLCLSDCQNITSDGFKLLHKLQILHYLEISGCAEITDDIFAHLEHLSTLTRLMISGCDKITCDGIEKLSGIKNLKILTITNCKEITDTGLACVAQLHTLKELDLSNCKKITDDGLIHIAKVKNLEYLSLFDCTNVTDGCLAQLANSSTLLYIDITFCRKITDKGISQAKEINPGLEISNSF